MHEHRVPRTLTAVALATVLLAAAPAPASDGKLEISQECVATGCFPGDPPDPPVLITQPGSYLLTSSVSGGTTAAIQIDASDVTLDLNGFSVSGVPAVGTGVILLTASGVEVRNGVVAGAGAAGGGGGIFASGESHLRLLDLRIHNHGGPGITIFGAANIEVRNSLVRGNGLAGASGGIIASGSGIAIVGCVATGNAGVGIQSGPGSLIADNVVRSNTENGITVNINSIVRGNVVSNNGEHGIDLNGQTLVIHNTAQDNNTTAMGFANIEACGSCVLVDNNAP
jgi:parallel beta-helix repeat protein